MPTESITAKGELSRQRTIIVLDEPDAPDHLQRGTVVAVRGLYADVDDGRQVVPCTVRRVLRTRLIKERSPVIVGDRVRFSLADGRPGAAVEGAIESVEPRKGQLRRLAGRKVHTMAVNIDQVLIVSSAAEPNPKPHLVDRYIVAAHHGEIAPVVCMNKIDLDHNGAAAAILERYAALGYKIIPSSIHSGAGVEQLKEVFAGKSTAVVGQSGVGKSSLLNLIQPDLELKTKEVMDQTGKGRHTTTTARLLRLDLGGYVVDTPGIRSFDVSIVPSTELEAYFVEFVDRVAHCKFSSCTHTHEESCAIISSVEAGEIHPDRYASYVELFAEAKERERR